MPEFSHPEIIRVLHWNVWHRADPSAVVERIGEIDPDIVCLVELAEDSSYFPGVNVGERIRDELDFVDGHHEPVHHLKAKSGSSWVKDGAGIFSKFPLAGIEVVTLSEKGWDTKYQSQDYRRIYLGATAILPSSSLLDIGSVHLSLPQSAIGHRGVRKQETEILSEVVGTKKNHFMLAGDFNAGLRAQSVRAMSQELVRIDDELAGSTWSRDIPILGRLSLHPAKRLDYIFVTPDINVINAQILPREPSDHHPLMVEVTAD